MRAIEAAARASGTPVDVMRAFTRTLIKRHEAAKKPATPVALREHGRTSKAEDLTPQLEAEFKRGGLSPAAAKIASRARGGRAPSSLYEAALAGGMSPAAAKAFAHGRGISEVVKNVAGLPATCFAWAVDAEDPTTWKLQIARSADNGSGEWSPDEDLVRAAVAQLPGVAGYGNALDIPAADLPGVKSILYSAWIACGAPIDEMPKELSQEALRAEFQRGGVTALQAALRGRQARRI